MRRRSGAGDGLQLALNIAAMLIAFLALIAMVNGILGWATRCRVWAGCRLRCSRFSAMVFAPVAWLLGVSWNDCATVGNLLGTRLVLNEFVAFLRSGQLKTAARSPIVHDRDLRAVRIRQLQLDRDPDRRHRSAGAHSQVRSGAPRPEGRGRGHHGEFHVGLHRGNAAVIGTPSNTSASRTTVRPRLAVVLGSGLGRFADELAERIDHPLRRYPGIGRYRRPSDTPGNWFSGKLGGLEVAVMAGRAISTKATRRRRSPSASVCWAGSACRHGIHQRRRRNQPVARARRAGADLATTSIFRAPIHWSGPTTTRSARDFPTCRKPTRRAIARSRKQVAQELGIPLAEGVYAAMLGPSYETPAEIRFLRTIGADLVGMSTVPEVIAANHMGISVLAISCVTNMAAGILPQKHQP